MPTLYEYYLFTRPFSLGLSILPSLIGSVLAVYYHKVDLDAKYFLTTFLCTFGCVLVHAVSNVVNDYYDFTSGVDTVDNFGVKNPLVHKALTKEQAKKFIGILFCTAVCIALALIMYSGWIIALVVVLGAFSAFAYTMPPFTFKNRGLGDIQVALSFGVLITVGSYLVQYPTFNLWNILRVIGVAIPQSMLAIAILHANNHRDRVSDKQHNVRTLSTRLSYKQSVSFQYILVVGAFVFQFCALCYSISSGQRFMPLPTSMCFLTVGFAFTVLSNIHMTEAPTLNQYHLHVAVAGTLARYFGSAVLIGFILEIIIVSAIL